MTRVLVLGTSHAMTLRRAAAQIAADHPEMSVTYWGLPGAAFATLRCDGDGVLRADPANLTGQRKLADWGLADHVDLRPFDHIFLVGIHYHQRALLKLLRGLQPWEWGYRPGAMRVSLGLLESAMTAEVALKLADQSANIPFDSRFVLMPAPCSAERVVTQGPLHEATTTALAESPYAARSFALLQKAMAAPHRALGVAFVPQPEATLARPWLTRDEFLIDPDADARHMNSNYGRIAFNALVAATR